MVQEISDAELPNYAAHSGGNLLKQGLRLKQFFVSHDDSIYQNNENNSGRGFKPDNI